MPNLLRPWGTVALTLTVALLLAGCVAGAVFPVPAGSSSSSESDPNRK